MIKIREKDSLITDILSDPDNTLEKILKYETEVWYQGTYAKEKVSKTVSLVSQGWFYSGYRKRVVEALSKRKIPVNYISKSKLPYIESKLKGITFREDQLKALGIIGTEQRGFWKAPMGSGKTILTAGALSMFSSGIVLIGGKKLYRQTVKEMKRFFPKVGVIESGKVEIEDITIAMKKTFCNMIKKKEFKHLATRWEMVVVDECHHVSAFKGEYYKLLRFLQCPVRLGFTATPPDEKQIASLVLEGLIGPMLGETEYKELEDIGVLAKPRMEFVKVPVLSDLGQEKLKRLKKVYQDVYVEGIVKNNKRNVAIVQKSIELINRGRTVLILIENIDHGKRLQRLFDISAKGVFVFLHGKTKDSIIDKEQERFERKERKGIIASRILGEGINIKSVGSVVNAVGGKSEIAVIQRLGRGTRATDDKDDVIFVDFLDINHSYFQRHTIDRICMYSDWGWL